MGCFTSPIFTVGLVADILVLDEEGLHPSESEG